jgi:hypothetical protein
MKRDLAPWPSDSRDHDAKEKFVAGNTACPQKDRTSQSGEDHRDRDHSQSAPTKEAYAWLTMSHECKTVIPAVRQ